MTFTTKTSAQEQIEQRQRDHSAAEVVVVRSYTQHPADDARAAESLWKTLPWSSTQAEEFIQQHGQRLRQEAETLVAKASELDITPQELMTLTASANATGMTIEEAAAQNATQKGHPAQLQDVRRRVRPMERRNDLLFARVQMGSPAYAADRSPARHEHGARPRRRVLALAGNPQQWLRHRLV